MDSTEPEYEWNVRAGDTLLIERPAEKFQARVVRVFDHGYYRIVDLRRCGEPVQVHLFRDEPDRRFGAIFHCRLVERRDRKERVRYNLD